MMGVGEVGVGMHHRLMPVSVGMLGTRFNRKIMGVLMMLVMDMLMTVLHHLVSMFMVMLFSKVQPDSNRHQRTGNNKRKRHWLSAEERQDGAEERGNGEVCTRAGGAQVAHPDHEKDQTQPIGEQPDHHGGRDSPPTWKRTSQSEAQRQIGAPRHGAFDGGNPRCVGQ